MEEQNAMLRDPLFANETLSLTEDMDVQLLGSSMVGPILCRTGLCNYGVGHYVLQLNPIMEVQIG